ncbi:MAG: ABC transporter permease [Methyloligellaceae bacterium]
MLSFSNYISLTIIGLHQSWQEKALISLQLITYAVLILIFSSIFLVTPFEELPASFAINATVMIWYIIMTELVTLSGGSHNFHDMREDIKAGNFSSGLQRPKSYLFIKILNITGANIVRVAIFFLFGIAMGVYFTKSFPYDWVQIPFLFTSLYLAAMIYSTMFCVLGLVEVWGPYSKPVMWIFQKFTFLFGGLILPLKLYPEWLQKLVWFTPFPSVFNIPGKIIFKPSVNEMLLGLITQCFWLGSMLFLCFFVQKIAYEKLLGTGE